MGMADLVATNVETPMIDSVCSLKKEFTKFIYMNPLMVLYVTVNKIDSCHDYTCGPLTRDTKDIMQMNNYVLIVTY